MSQSAQADVIVLTNCDTAELFRSTQSVLEKSGGTLRRLILPIPSSRRQEVAKSLESLRIHDTRIVTVHGPSELGAVDLCNLALGQRAGDAVLMCGGAVASHGWLSELAAVAHAAERTSCAAPLTDCDLAWPVPARHDDMRFEPVDPATVRAACARLPRSVDAPPGACSHCLYLRGDVIDAVGLLDGCMTSLESAIGDWLLRARSLGYVARLANHAFVQCPAGPQPDSCYPDPHNQDPSDSEDPDASIKNHRQGVGRSLDLHLAVHAVRLESAGRLRIACDIRHMPAEQVGTRTYAVSLAQALARLPEIELTLLVRTPAQARGLKGRVLTAEQWADDVALIHKPGQVIDRGELPLLFESSAHLVITYQDLIAFRIPVAFPGNAQFEEYRATSRLILPTAQGVIAISESVRREIESEFGIPREEIPVVAHGVESAWFSERGPRDSLIRAALRLPRQYYFSVASDYPHKNLQTLLDAYAQLRRSCTSGEPPALVIAGYTSGAHGGLYPRLESQSLDRGVIFLGPVSRHQLRVLYQDALALVFSSLYEGFGLPPLEAMAAGTPVIAMPISAVPEVAGDCVLYPDGLSVSDLERAMTRLASSEPLRNDLRERGRIWVEQFRWEKTARASAEFYRSTILRPSERSLRMRRLLRDAIINWSGNETARSSSVSSPDRGDPIPPSVGIRNAWRSLQVALRTRLNRELRRYPLLTGRRSA